MCIHMCMRLCTDMRERVQIDLCMRMFMDMRIWTDMYVKEKSEVEAKTQQLKSMTAAWKKVRRSHIRTHAFMHAHLHPPEHIQMHKCEKV